MTMSVDEAMYSTAAGEGGSAAAKALRAEVLRLRGEYNRGVEDAAKVADTEEELDSLPPLNIQRQIRSDPVAVLRATVRATKSSIAERIRALAKPAAARNQCDGCAAGIAVDPNGNHHMGPGGLQRCQREKYAPAAAPAACGKCLCGALDCRVTQHAWTQAPCALDAGHDGACKAVR